MLNHKELYLSNISLENRSKSNDKTIKNSCILKVKFKIGQEEIKITHNLCSKNFKLKLSKTIEKIKNLSELYTKLKEKFNEEIELETEYNEYENEDESDNFLSEESQASEEESQIRIDTLTKKVFKTRDCVQISLFDRF